MVVLVQASDLGLVDDLMTSEEYVRSRMLDCTVIAMEPATKRKSFLEKLQQVQNSALQSVNALHTSLTAMTTANGVVSRAAGAAGAAGAVGAAGVGPAAHELASLVDSARTQDIQFRYDEAGTRTHLR